MDLKKEIKLSDLFRRERKPRAPKSSTPFWKKELSLRRKPKPAEPAELVPVGDDDWVRQQLALAAAAAAEPPPTKEKKESVLKREISFKRKPAAKPPVRDSGPVEGAPGEPGGSPGRTSDKKPFWKQEISLARKPAAKPPVRDSGPGEGVPGEPGGSTGEPKKPLWKREISLARKPKAPKAPKTARSPKASTPKRLVGLKIGASGLAAARVANNGHAELLQLAREPLPPGVVVGGELRDPEALAEALKAFFRKHKLPRRGIRLGIASNRIGVRTLDIVGIVDPKQLANAIRFRAQEALPIPVEEAVLDYRILSEAETEEGERICRVLLVVAYRELVDRYVAACRKAGLTVVGIDLEAFALLRSLSPPRLAEEEAPEAALVAVAIGHDRSTFAVSDGTVCEFTRVLGWGGHALDVAVAQELDLTPSEAEPIKRTLSLAGGPAPQGLTDEQAEAAREAMRRQVQAFARELVSSLQFYQGQPGSLGIGKIVLTGGTAHLHGLPDELERLIGVRVSVGDPLERVKPGKRLQTPDPVGSLAVAIGLGIED
jgi:type IV pilus assembly protein PilM